MIKQSKGITLVALVITIIILLILAGITIAQLTGNGFFEKAKLAKEKSENAQIEENSILSEYESTINDYVSASRDENTKIQSLINKNDGVYNVTEGGYIYNTSTTQTAVNTNNTIKLTDSINNYNFIEFELDVYMVDVGGYTFPYTQILSTSQLRDKYNTSGMQDLSKSFMITHLVGDTYNRVICSLKNDTTINVEATCTNYNNYPKFRITDIKGIK